MARARLIHRLWVEIAIFPTVEEQQDDVWRTNLRSTAEILADPDTPKVRVPTQAKFGRFEALVPMATGNNEDTDGYLLIEDKDQERHQFKVNDHVIRLLARGKRPQCVQLRITQVKPAAQRGAFGLHRIDFKDDSRGRQ